MPPHLGEAINELVERSAAAAVEGVEKSEAVEQLVSVARWNPALLMAAAEQAAELADRCAGEELDRAVVNLRAAEKRVRQRVY